MVAEIIKEPKDKSEVEKTLENIEGQIKKLITDKKELKNKFLAKLKEVEKQRKENQEWFDKNWKEAENIENKLILLWDYWQREVEISNLNKKIQSGVLPSEREIIIEKIKELNKYNLTLERGFKKRSIDKEIVIELRKKLGAWEEEKEEEL